MYFQWDQLIIGTGLIIGFVYNTTISVLAALSFKTSTKQMYTEYKETIARSIWFCAKQFTSVLFHH